MERKWRVAFLCKSNSSRSQIAEALGNKFASDVMECYSAGVENSKDVDPRAVQILNEMYDLDIIEEGYRSKLITELPEIDIIIYMGCNVKCAQIPCQMEFDWGIANTKDKSDEDFKKIVKEIKKNILELRKNIISGRIEKWRKDEIAFDFATVFPFWDRLEQQEKERINTGWRMELINKNRQIYRYSDGCKGLMIVRKGCLRVYIISDEGRDVTLYRLYPGDVCVLSAACLIQEIDFEVLIEASEETESITIPADDLRQIMDENIWMKNFMYKKTLERFSDVMWTMQHILFKKVDQRIAQYLWDEMQYQNSNIITVTHDNIAKDVGSVREIVTKVLHQMAEKKIIKNGYGKVEILNRDKLFSMI